MKRAERGQQHSLRQISCRAKQDERVGGERHCGSLQKESVRVTTRAECVQELVQSIASAYAASFLDWRHHHGQENIRFGASIALAASVVAPLIRNIACPVWQARERDGECRGMRLILAGGRHFDDSRMVGDALSALHRIRPFAVLIHGGCPGIGIPAEAWGRRHGIHIVRYPPPSVLPRRTGRGGEGRGGNTCRARGRTGDHHSSVTGISFR